MSSASFSMSDDSRQRVSVRRRSTNAATATSRAADEALQHVLDRRLRKREGRLPPPSRQAAVRGGAAAVAPSGNRFGSPQWLLRAGVLGFVAVVLGVAVLTSAGRGATSHTVAGRVLLGKNPLRNATISFHSASGATQEPVALTTAADGSFRIEADRPLPAGLYAVVVDGAGAGKTALVPAPYRDPGTTPLRVLVTENLTGLQLLVRR